MKPLLAHVYEPHRVTFPCYVQPKLNGIRALYQGGRFQSRDELPFPVGLLDHLSEPLRKIFGPETILDGELYVHGWPLQRINAAVTPVRLTPTEDTLKVEYHVFDVVDFGKSFEDRYVTNLPVLYPHFLGLQSQRISTELVYSNEQADDRYSRFVSQGYEGMMYRLGDCPYTVPKQEYDIEGMNMLYGKDVVKANLRSKYMSDKDNRCWHLLKRKDWQDDEFECYYTVEGEGKLQGTLGALLCYAKGPTKIGLGGKILSKCLPFSVGSGLTDSERQHYWQNPPIGRLVKVKYLCLSSDGIPLNPTILAIL